MYFGKNNKQKNNLELTNSGHNQTINMRDLAPSIYRQRMVVEGTCNKRIEDSDIKRYLSELSSVLKMKTLIEPITHRSDRFGWAGWIHWETSGAHFYAWDEPFVFFSVDIYTCKEFSSQDAVSFTQEFFNTTDIAFKDF